MEKNTKLIIGVIAVAAFVGYIIFRKPKKTTPVPNPSPSLDPLPVDTLPPVTSEEFNTIPVAYGATKEEACLNKSIATVTLYSKSPSLDTNTILYSDSSHKTPVKSGYYSDKFDTLYVVADGGLLTEITICL